MVLLAACGDDAGGGDDAGLDAGADAQLRDADGRDDGVPLDAGPLPGCEEGALFVAPDGDDGAAGGTADPFRTVQHALDVAGPGTTVCVRAGTYAERLTIAGGGTDGAWLTLRSAPGETVVLTAAGAGAGTADNMIYLSGVAYVRVAGLTILGAGRVNDASGIRIAGAAHHIELSGNQISEMRGQSAMGITVYGADGEGITDVVIDGNVIESCDPAPSEALVVNGNVRRFRITGNVVRDVNNIGIDVIGGESDISTAFPDDGLVRGNRVERANSSYDGSAACIYSDGASNLVIEGNVVSECDFGIEVGAENPGVVTRAVMVRSNFVYGNFRGGIIFGGYDAGRGRVRETAFVHNTLYRNGRPGQDTRFGFEGADNGEVIVQFADDCTVANNVLSGLPDTAELVAMWGEASGLVFEGNLYFNPGTPAASPGGTGAVVADPRLVDPDAGDLHLAAGSPAAGAALPRTDRGDADIDGDPRVQGPPDIGADEVP